MATSVDLACRALAVGRKQTARDLRKREARMEEMMDKSHLAVKKVKVL